MQIPDCINIFKAMKKYFEWQTATDDGPIKLSEKFKGDEGMIHRRTMAMRFVFFMLRSAIPLAIIILGIYCITMWFVVKCNVEKISYIIQLFHYFIFALICFIVIIYGILSAMIVLCWAAPSKAIDIKKLEINNKGFTLEINSKNEKSKTEN